jgi:hypothetical protein
MHRQEGRKEKMDSHSTSETQKNTGRAGDESMRTSKRREQLAGIVPGRRHVRVAVDIGADLVGQGDAALARQGGGAGDVGSAGGAVGDVLEAAADGAAVGGVVGLRQQAADAAAARLRGHRAAHLHVRQARHQGVVHGAARQGRAHRRRGSRHGRRQEHGQRQRREPRTSHAC